MDSSMEAVGLGGACICILGKLVVVLWGFAALVFLATCVCLPEQSCVSSLLLVSTGGWSFVSELIGLRFGLASVVAIRVCRRQPPHRFGFTSSRSRLLRSFVVAKEF